MREQQRNAKGTVGAGVGRLFVVPTPIGNLGDMTARSIEVLRAADAVLAEDTRVTGRLLSALGIRARIERCDENVIARRSAGLVERMRDGERLAFCSDAGMPGVSDPGAVLVDAAREAGVDVEVLPGASAVTTALVAAGFGGTAFFFGGFLPRKEKGRRDLLAGLAQLPAALVFYESPHRVAASAASIAAVLGTRRVALCRELTKAHEEVCRLPADELARDLASRADIRGEIVLVVEPPRPQAAPAAPDLDSPELHMRIAAELDAGARTGELAKRLSRELGVSKNGLYELVVRISDESATRPGSPDGK